VIVVLEKKNIALLRIVVYLFEYQYKDRIAAGTSVSFECKWNSDLPPSDASSVKELLSFSMPSRWQDSFSLFVYVCMQQVHRTRKKKKKERRKNGLVDWRSRNLNFFDWIEWPLGRGEKKKRMIGFLRFSFFLLFSSLPLRDWWI
jgi:hypothetical protein